MKGFLLATVALAGLAAPAWAADLAPRYTKAPAIAPVVSYNWTGCYLGGYVGGATQNRSVNATDPVAQPGGVFAPGTFYNTPNSNAANGGRFSYDLGSTVIGGGTLGCNWQGAGSPWVVGVEGEGGYMRLRGTAVDPFSLGPVVSYGGDTTATTRIGEAYGAITGRLGYAWDRVLVYGKAGAGFANVNSSFVDACTTGACGGGTLNAGRSSDRAFWVAGGGIEYAFDQNWSVKGEYLYLGLRENYAVCGPGGAAATGSTFCGTSSVDGIHTAKVGLNYRFNTPWLARY